MCRHSSAQSRSRSEHPRRWRGQESVHRCRRGGNDEKIPRQKGSDYWGGRGIGLATVRRFAEEGAVVTLTGRDGEVALSAAREVSTQTGSEIYAFRGMSLSVRTTGQR